jgi:hypothetical protein
MVIRIRASMKELTRLKKGFHKEPIEIEVRQTTESPDAYLVVTYVSNKNWRDVVYE